MAIAYLLNSYDRFYGDVRSSVEVYTKQCSTMTTTQDIAIMGATLANNGINPKTNKKVIDSKYYNSPQSRQRIYIICDKNKMYTFKNIDNPIVSVSSIIDNSIIDFFDFAEKYRLEK